MKTRTKTGPPAEPEPEPEEEIPGEDEPFELPGCADPAAEDRMLIDCLLAVLAVRHAADLHPRAGLALAWAQVAACERIGRICGSDLPGPSDLT